MIVERQNEVPQDRQASKADQKRHGVRSIVPPS